MAGVEDRPVAVLRSLVQAVAAGFAISHLQPEAPEKVQGHLRVEPHRASRSQHLRRCSREEEGGLVEGSGWVGCLGRDLLDLPGTGGRPSLSLMETWTYLPCTDGDVAISL